MGKVQERVRKLNGEHTERVRKSHKRVRIKSGKSQKKSGESQEKGKLEYSLPIRYDHIYTI